ncbi:MAG: nanA 2 [Verrucomicrobia bacterium]|nr:nanA 2 [Verrucomicrobiota bacterium]
MKFTLLSGLIAAPYTPFDVEGRLNLARIPDLAAALRRNGVQGAFVCGTTGEGTALTNEERRKVADAWTRARPSGLVVIVHVGHNCLSESVALAQHAASMGADAFAMLPPSQPRPATLDDLIACCAMVAAAAPGLPFYYYHMPAATGVNFAMADFLRTAAPRIPNLAGIKFTYEHLMDFGQALAFDPARYAVLHGRDETLLAGLALGAKGAVGSTYNYAAPVYHRVMRAFAAGDIATARREQALAVRIVEIMVRHGGLAAGKMIMKLIGLDCGGMRLPQRSITAAAEEQLKDDLTAAGFFEAIRQI